MTNPRSRTDVLAAGSLLLASVGLVGGFYLPPLTYLAVAAFALGAIAEWHAIRAKARTPAHVLAIAGVCISLLTLGIWTPSFFKASAQRGEYVCAEHEKRLAAAVLMYAERHDDQLPPAEEWADCIAPLVADRADFSCPGAPGKRSDYAFNRALGSKRIADLSDPGHTVLLFESDVGWNRSGTADDLPPRPRHAGRDLFAFVDGHVKAVGRNHDATIRWYP
jgi:hypothetical protein